MTVPEIDIEVLRSLCSILGDTSSGLSGSEMGALLEASGISDPLRGATKRHRLFEALNLKQQQDRCANNVVSFVQQAMSPVRYVGRVDHFESQRSALNEVLAFAAMKLREDGILSLQSR